MLGPMPPAPRQDLSTPPERIDGPSAWLGPVLRDAPGSWLHALSDEEIEDLERAARRFLELDSDLGAITAEAFPLTVAAAPVRELRRRLLHGPGLALLRGFPLERHDRRFAATVFCGIGAHLGRARSQNARGHTLGHVRDVGADAKDPGTRIYQTRERQTFHTDSADAVGLLCLRTAKAGGRSLVASAGSIYNRMRAEAPALVERLFDPIATDRRGEVPDGARPFVEIPPLSWHAGRLTVFYQRQYIDSARRFEGAMRLTPGHVAALDRFDALADDPALHLAMDLEPGDVQLVHNHSLLHDRTAFTDWPEPERRRHLLRLWLSLPGDRPLPQAFAERYGSVAVGRRGGVAVGAARLVAPLD